MRGRQITRALAVALLVGGGPACAQILGDDFEIRDTGGGPTGGGPSCDEQSFDCESCGACAQGEPCSSESQACFTNPECVAIDDCIFFQCSPPDQACADGCGAMHPSGIDDFNALFLCIQGECACTCTGSCA